MTASTITNIQRMIKQLQKDALRQIQLTHSEQLGRIHQIMQENGLTPEMVALSFKMKKSRSKKAGIESRTTLKLPVGQK